MIRHAVVSPAARSVLYGRMDVALCADSLHLQAEAYQALAKRLPRGAAWVVSPLTRTRHTAEAIFRAGYPAAELQVEPDLIEQDLGAWQGLAHADLPARLTGQAHPFWPVGAEEVPLGGESMTQVVVRVGLAIERLACVHRGVDIVCVSHGGAIRAAVAHAARASAASALHFSIQNLSLTILERFSTGWRIVQVNEGADIAE